MFHRALICTDFEDGLHRLVNFVPSLAKSGLSHIGFLHTLSLGDEREIPRPDLEKERKVRERLAVAQSSVPEGVTVEIDVQSGRPIDHIMDAVRRYQSDVILLGTESRSRLTEKLFGSTTVELCKRLDVPLMILRPQLISTYTVEELDLRCQHLFRYFLIPYDDSTAAKYLVQKIKDIAPHRPPESLKQCLLMWVVESVGRQALKDVRTFQAQEAEETIEAVKTDLATLNLDVEALVWQGTPITEVQRAAMEYDISAITISSDSFGKLLEWSVPSFAGELLRRSWHPVIYFPNSRK